MKKEWTDRDKEKKQIINQAKVIIDLIYPPTWKELLNSVPEDYGIHGRAIQLCEKLLWKSKFGRSHVTLYVVCGGCSGVSGAPKLPENLDGYPEAPPEPTCDGASVHLRRAWERRVERGDRDTAILWLKGHRGIPGNEEADKAARIGTALQDEPDMVTEAGLRQRAKRERASERNRLNLSYRPLERLVRATGRIAGLLGGKGLRAWRWQIGKADQTVRTAGGVERKKRQRHTYSRNAGHGGGDGSGGRRTSGDPPGTRKGKKTR
ncbi:hypothetical protein BDZ91DRAFT_799105 [Kalaharituber pfeilii]|nr:hypothetical protein BDZ91DRAFT_799105 [Kalaharituber pfeilii]